MTIAEQYVAFQTILIKEVLRFARIWVQTVLPPIITTVLYFIIFGNLIGERIGEMEGVRYIDYIVPGLIGMVLGDFAGGAAAVMVMERLLVASYTQRAESDADTFALEALDAAGLPAESLASFFETLKDELDIGDPGLFSHLASHPDLGSRAAAARRAETVSGDFEPVLSASEWAALREICKSPAGSGKEDAGSAN